MKSVYYVDRPVVDLVREPKNPETKNFSDSNRESQLLYNEEVNILNEEKDWCFVEAVEQLSFRQRGYWAPYTGWVRKEYLRESQSRLSFNGIVKVPFCLVESQGEKTLLLFGTRVAVEPISGDIFRYFDGKKTGYIKAGASTLFLHGDKSSVGKSDIVNVAKLFNGCPYLWGGRSIKCIEAENYWILTGVDCSGFVNLVFRANGIDIPRDAHEQFIVSEKIKATELDMGDLIFVCSKSNPEIINHVMIYCGDDIFIDASSQERKVEERTFRDRFSIEISKIDEKMVEVGELYLLFGRIFRRDE